VWLFNITGKSLLGACPVHANEVNACQQAMEKQREKQMEFAAVRLLGVRVLPIRRDCRAGAVVHVTLTLT
jgi:hypothetical protein